MTITAAAHGAPRQLVQAGDPCSQHLTDAADELPAGEVIGLLQELPTWSERTGTLPSRRCRGVERVLEWLESWPGAGWQARWTAAAGDHDLSWIERLAAGDPRTAGTNLVELRAGLNWLFLGRVLRPGYGYFAHTKAAFLFEQVPRVISAELFERLGRDAAASTVTAREHTMARRALVKLALHTGKDVEQLSAEDLFEFRAWMSRHGKANKGLSTAWDLLRDAGVLAATGSLRESARCGQRTVSELVDAYGIRSNTVRQVLIRYLDERRPSLDYNSLRALTGDLAGRFWADIEAHNPGIDSHDLPDEIAQAWKERLRVVRSRNGQTRPRTTWLETLTRVRAFYLDIQEWAHTDPSWIALVARSPVRRGDTEGIVKARRQATARMHQRVRERLPQLPVLVDVAERHRDAQAALLEAAAACPAGSVFTCAGRSYRRIVAKDGPGGQRYRGPDTVWVEDIDTGTRIDVTRAEDDAFWAWAVIETLRHTGVRLEELLEITHLALTSYQLPATGDVVPLLQIRPRATRNDCCWSARNWPAS
jgi:hypothetical protein